MLRTVCFDEDGMAVVRDDVLLARGEVAPVAGAAAIDVLKIPEAPVATDRAIFSGPILQQPVVQQHLHKVELGCFGDVFQATAPRLTVKAASLLGDPVPCVRRVHKVRLLGSLTGGLQHLLGHGLGALRVRRHPPLAPLWRGEWRAGSFLRWCSRHAF
jgi:hypothetical protein